MRDHHQSLASAREALDGLSVGDALGEALSYRFYKAREVCDFSVFRDGSVRYTDDTEMALAIYETLRVSHTIEEDLLAQHFAMRFERDPDRGYGKMARRILSEISAGASREELSKNAFGRGSFGNGAAMRVAPLGAYFADDPDAIPDLAAKSARVTHSHPEGIAGAIAVAVSAAVAWRSRARARGEAAAAVWSAAMDYTPDGEVRNRIGRAKLLGAIPPEEAARILGNGTEISAQDTVPFCLWNACRCLDDYKEAIISTIEVGGDCDTNSAIVGGIVASYAGRESIPADWLRVRERLDIGE
jgi:ADP-ribosylglycohydrolase